MRIWRRLYSELRYLNALNITRSKGFYSIQQPIANQFGLESEIEVGDFEDVSKTIVADTQRPIVVRNETNHVVRVVSNGTILRDSLSDAFRHNYIAAVCIRAVDRIGITWADLNDGTIKYQETEYENLADDLARISPYEVLLETAIEDVEGIFDQFPVTLAEFPREFGDLYKLFDTPHILKHAEAGMPFHTTCSMAGLLGYIRNSTSFSVKFGAPKHYLRENTMEMDKRTRSTLELFSASAKTSTRGSLFSVIKRTKTQSGARMLQETLSNPFRSTADINKRLDTVGILLDDPILLLRIKNCLQGYPDAKVAIRKLLDDKTTHSIHRWAEAMERMKDVLSVVEGTQLSDWSLRLSECISQTGKLSLKISRYMRDTEDEELEHSKTYRPIFDPRFSKSLKDLYKRSEDFDILCNRVAEKYAKKYNKKVEIKHTVAHGYHVVIKGGGGVSEEEDNNIILRSGPRSTALKDDDLYQAGKLKEQFNTRLLKLEEKLVEKLRKQIQELNAIVRAGMDTVDEIDIAQSFATLAQENQLVRPTLVDDRVIDIVEGRHIAVEQLLTLQEGSDFVANDCKLIKNKVCLVTGPNMGGKSTFMRQIASIAILAHMGSYVPAEAATIGSIDKIFCRIGAADDGYKGQSTFMVEMLETSHILRNATAQSLALLDEVGRGTSKRDGVALAYGVIHYIYTKTQCRALFSTHFGPSIANLIKEKELSIETLNSKNYKMVPGVCLDSKGIELARSTDFPKKVIAHAKKYLDKNQ